MLDQRHSDPLISQGAFFAMSQAKSRECRNIQVFPPEMGAGKRRIVVAGILDPGLTHRPQACDQPGIFDAKERAKQAKAFAFADRGHAGKTGSTALTIPAHLNGFRLISQVVGTQKMEATPFATPIRKQAVARLSRLVLNATFRLFSSPGKTVMLDPPSRKPLADKVGFIVRGVPKTVINGEADHASPPRPRPLISEQGQCEAVSTARNGDREQRRSLERLETSHPSFKFLGVDGLIGEAAACRFFYRSRDGELFGSFT